MISPFDSRMLSESQHGKTCSNTGSLYIPQREKLKKKVRRKEKEKSKLFMITDFEYRNG